jgi:hypothetical protein
MRDNEREYSRVTLDEDFCDCTGDGLGRWFWVSLALASALLLFVLWATI